MSRALAPPPPPSGSSLMKVQARAPPPPNAQGAAPAPPPPSSFTARASLGTGLSSAPSPPSQAPALRQTAPGAPRGLSVRPTTQVNANLASLLPPPQAQTKVRKVSTPGTASKEKSKEKSPAPAPKEEKKLKAKAKSEIEAEMQISSTQLEFDAQPTMEQLDFQDGFHGEAPVVTKPGRREMPPTPTGTSSVLGESAPSEVAGSVSGSMGGFFRKLSLKRGDAPALQLEGNKNADQEKLEKAKAAEEEKKKKQAEKDAKKAEKEQAKKAAKEKKTKKEEAPKGNLHNFEHSQQSDSGVMSSSTPEEQLPQVELQLQLEPPPILPPKQNNANRLAPTGNLGRPRSRLPDPPSVEPPPPPPRPDFPDAAPMPPNRQPPEEREIPVLRRSQVQSQVSPSKAAMSSTGTSNLAADPSGGNKSQASVQRKSSLGSGDTRSSAKPGSSGKDKGKDKGKEKGKEK